MPILHFQLTNFPPQGIHLVRMACRDIAAGSFFIGFCSSARGRSIDPGQSPKCDTCWLLAHALTD